MELIPRAPESAKTEEVSHVQENSACKRRARNAEPAGRRRRAAILRHLRSRPPLLLGRPPLSRPEQSRDRRRAHWRRARLRNWRSERRQLRLSELRIQLSELRL